MSTLALEPSSQAPGAGGPASCARFDLVLLAVALPVFVLAGLPLVAYAAVAAAWLAQRADPAYAETRMARADRAH